MARGPCRVRRAGRVLPGRQHLLARGTAEPFSLTVRSVAQRVTREGIGASDTCVTTTSCYRSRNDAARRRNPVCPVSWPPRRGTGRPGRIARPVIRSPRGDPRPARVRTRANDGTARAMWITGRCAHRRPLPAARCPCRRGRSSSARVIPARSDRGRVGHRLDGGAEPDHPGGDGGRSARERQEHRHVEKILGRHERRVGPGRAGENDAADHGEEEGDPLEAGSASPGATARSRRAAGACPGAAPR